MSVPVGSSAEENALCYPDDRSLKIFYQLLKPTYFTGIEVKISLSMNLPTQCIFWVSVLHFPHLIQNFRLFMIEQGTSKLRLQYQIEIIPIITLRSANIYGSHYAMTNSEEYFAEGVQSYFDANYKQSNVPTTR